MQKEYPVYACLHGKEKQTLLGVVAPYDEPVKPFTFTTDTDVYRTYIHESAFAHNHIVLFDGLLIPRGLPSGAEQLIYEYGRHEDKFHVVSQKKILVIAECVSAVGGGRIAHDPVAPQFDERVAHRREEKTQITLCRYLLLLPKGHTAIGLRIRPRSLERQYTCIESTKNDVIFRTIVR